MAERALDIYVNDHRAGATMGSEIAGHLRDQNEGTPLGELMASLAAEIDSDRQTLDDLAERLGTSSNPVKQGVAWLAEKASQVKLSGVTSGNPGLGTFLALETLSLGVEGKISLWRCLKAIADDQPAFTGIDFDDLIERGQTQRRALETERMEVGTRVLRGGDA